MNSTYDVYIDGEFVMSVNDEGSQLSPAIPTGVSFRTISNGKVAFKHSGRSYYYVNATKFTSAQQSKEIGNLATALSLLPGGIGAGFGVAALVKGLTGSAKNRWFTVKMYCTKNYKYYAFKTYAYKNAKRTKLASTKTTYKTMF